MHLHRWGKLTDMQSNESWVENLAKQIGKGIDSARGKHSDQWIADRTAMLGHPMSRTAISEYRRGKRKIVPVTDLFVIAAALGVPPVALLFPGLPDARSELIPATDKPVAFDALQWVTGERQTLPEGFDVLFDIESGEMMGVVEGCREYRKSLEHHGGVFDLNHENEPSREKQLIDACRELSSIFEELHKLSSSAFVDFADSMSQEHRTASLKMHMELVQKYHDRCAEIENRIQILGGIIAEGSMQSVESQNGED